MNSYMKHFCDRSVPEAKAPIHDCPHSSRVSGGRLQPNYDHERKQISCVLSKCKFLKLLIIAHLFACSLSLLYFDFSTLDVQLYSTVQEFFESI